MRTIFPIVEGEGDQIAVPELLRRCLAELQAFEVVLVKPMKVGDIKSVLKGQRFEKAIKYAQLQHPDSLTLICTDLDDGCVLENVRKVQERVLGIMPELLNPVGVVLFKREYESMFLANLEEIIRVIPQVISAERTSNGVDVCARDAKGVMSSVMRDTTYKEIRDQVRFTACVTVPQWRARYRPLDHLVRVLEWRLRWKGGDFVYGNLSAQG